uniref:BHLH domain-containing protein n=1 Tax=Zea mays TaxID=4577 RepID=A0A804LRH0_MAIZE
MNYPDAAADPWCCYSNNAGEAAAAAAVPTSGEEASRFFGDMVAAADYSTDDLFELVLEQEGGAPGPGSMHPTVSCVWSSRFSKPPDVRFDPPSEDEMAAWLCTIVNGDEPACNDDNGDGDRLAADDGQEDGVPVMGTSTTTADKKEKAPTTTTVEGMMIMGNKEMRKAPAGGGSSRRSHHGEAHNLTEKRRRHKINERFKTLQQIVPGCSKSNQASTLDQTIHYMKSLQHQVQAMSSAGLLAPAAAAYPAVVQPRCVPLGTTPPVPFQAAAPTTMVLGGYHPPSSPATMVPFGTTAVLQLPHYPGDAAAVMVPVEPLYPAAAAPAAAAKGRAVAACVCE